MTEEIVVGPREEVRMLIRSLLSESKNEIVLEKLQKLVDGIASIQSNGTVDLGFHDLVLADLGEILADELEARINIVTMSCDICGKPTFETEIRVLNDETVCPDCYFSCLTDNMFWAFILQICHCFWNSIRDRKQKHRMQDIQIPQFHDDFRTVQIGCECGKVFWEATEW